MRKSRLCKLFILFFEYLSTQGRIFSQSVYIIHLFNLQSDRLESAKVNSMDGQFVKYTQVNFKCY